MAKEFKEVISPVPPMQLESTLLGVKEVNFRTWGAFNVQFAAPVAQIPCLLFFHTLCTALLM